MKEESKKIVLPLGTVSWEKELGSYYIDMSPAKIHYTDTIYDGQFDENGVPMIGTSNCEHVYSPINIAQYGFMLHAEYLDTPNQHTLQTLRHCVAMLEQTKTETDDYTVWWHNFFEVKYKIRPPWASAMAQGEVISFYLRMHQLLGDEELLTTAIKAYRFMQRDDIPGAVRRFDEQGNLWLEEYPSNPPSFVLNGFIYALFGIIDICRVTDMPEAKADIDRCLSTLKNRLHDFDAGYWSYYDLQKRELVRYYYQQNVHVPQLEILYQLTGELLFKKYAVRWKRQINPISFFLVQIMYRVLPRYRKVLTLPARL